jgi:copper chaperone CopZ
MVRRIIKIEGMMCENCTAKVEAALNTLPGVISVVANHKKGNAIVECEKNISDEDLIMSVIDAGFRARIKHGLFR